MYLERLQIEEGFLSGLDVNFKPGLNVIIGARGTGKTSLIELIRFCLDAKGNMQEPNKKSKEHALSILGSGQVTASLSLGSQQIIASRTAADSISRSTNDFQKPIIFSQTEVETIGLDPSGRLRLIDSFITSQEEDDTEERQVIAAIASLTTESTATRRELEELQGVIRESANIELELKTISQQEAGVASTSSVLQEKAAYLQALSEKISKNSVNEVNYQRAQSEIYSWYAKSKEALDYKIQSINDHNHSLVEFKSDIEIAREKLTQATNTIASIWHSLEKSKISIASEKIKDEAIAREARQNIELMQAGAGQVMRKGQELREKKAKLESLFGVLKSTTSTLNNIIKKRNAEFERLEEIRNSRSKSRELIVQRLNRALSPNIRIKITRNGQQSRFASIISDMLRGSGLKYNDIALQIASAVSPRMLLEAAEKFDTALISESAGITAERAARVLTHLKMSDLGFLGSIDLDDEVSMQLLDGSDYKDISELSTGQRCTVILPIILTHTERVVIVDQPEDHIDNAFITSTLIKAVLARTPDSQIIFSTHNPNIPVLGDADNVIQLGSDGKRGYILAKGSLSENQVVDAISTVMEGGAEAFARRSVFYSQFRS